MKSKSLKKIFKKRFEEKVIFAVASSCWLWKGAKGKNSYGKMSIDGKHKKAHRISWEIYVGEIPKDMHVLHKCDNPPCVNPNHLFLGTQADNNKDMFSKGRGYDRNGVNNPRAKFTAKEVKIIRSRHENQYDLAEEYGVSQSTISRIQRGEVY